MKKIIILFAAITAVTLWGCSEESNEKSENTDFVELSSNALAVGAEGGDATITVKSSSDWRVIGSSELVTLSAEEGHNGDKLTFTVNPNDTEDCQEVVYKIFAGSAVQKLIVTSNPTFGLSLVSDATISINSDTHTERVTFVSNIPDLAYKFTEGGESWVTPVETKEAFGKKIAALDIKENTTYLPRTTVFSIESNDKKVEVTINQEPTEAILLEETSYTYDLQERDVQLAIKTNVEYQVKNMPEWMELTNTLKGETAADGLQEHTLTIHIKASDGSRKGEFSFNYLNTPLLTVSIKQQNPNPTMITIPDLKFRQALSENGWVILGADNDTKCELLGPGMTSTELNVSGRSSYNKKEITSLEGIENFPQIETLNVKNNKFSVIDISKLTKVKSIEVTGNTGLTALKLGNNPITTLNLEAALDETQSLTISGEQLTDIKAFYSSWWEDGDTIQELDLTGCPNLKSCNANRNQLKTIYVTAAQKESVKFEIKTSTTIVVK